MVRLLHFMRGETKVRTAEASKHSKKTGINAAAYMVCKKMGLLVEE